MLILVRETNKKKWMKPLVEQRSHQGKKKKEKAVSICNKLQGVTKRILNGEAIKGNEEKRMENRRKDFHTSL